MLIFFGFLNFLFLYFIMGFFPFIDLQHICIHVCTCTYNTYYCYPFTAAKDFATPTHLVFQRKTPKPPVTYSPTRREIVTFHARRDTI